MTNKEALKAWEKFYTEIDKENWLFVGTINPEMVSLAIKALEERPQDKWIPVCERLPNDLEPVNITWINHEPEPYYKEIKDKPFTATGVYFNGQWYWWSTLCTDILAEYSNNYDDIIDTAIEVIAWQPLPEPYKGGDNNE